MRRRFENVNMVMGNCFSPVMEGSQFQWDNIVGRLYTTLHHKYRKLFFYI